MGTKQLTAKKNPREALIKQIESNLYLILIEGIEKLLRLVTQQDDDGKFNAKEFVANFEALEALQEKLELQGDRQSSIHINWSTFVPKFATLKYAYNKARHKVIVSPRGMGKTHNSARIWLEYLITEQDNDMTWFRHTESAVYDSFVKLFASIIAKERLSKYCSIKKNNNNGLWEIRSPYTNSVLDFRGGFSTHNLKGIEGKNKLLFDEATEFDKDALLKLEGNIKRDDRVELWYCFNHGKQSKHIQIDSEVLVEAMQKRNAYLLKLKPEDNIYVSSSYLANLEGFKYLSPEAYYEATGKKVDSLSCQDQKTNPYKNLNIIRQTIQSRYKGES